MQHVAEVQPDGGRVARPFHRVTRMLGRHRGLGLGDIEQATLARRVGPRGEGVPDVHVRDARQVERHAAGQKHGTDDSQADPLRGARVPTRVQPGAPLVKHSTLPGSKRIPWGAPPPDPATRGSRRCDTVATPSRAVLKCDARRRTPATMGLEENSHIGVERGMHAAARLSGQGNRDCWPARAPSLDGIGRLVLGDDPDRVGTRSDVAGAFFDRRLEERDRRLQQLHDRPSGKSQTTVNETARNRPGGPLAPLARLHKERVHDPLSGNAGG
jgi:hypothetical protein